MKATLPKLKIQITKDLIKEVIRIVRDAGDAIMEVYQTDFDVRIKDDFSPVTQADIKANTIIETGLKSFDHTIPILSEEGKEIIYEVRKDWDTFWLVDPLDGTKDFIKKNGEFTVNIALVEDQVPVFGVVYAPASDLLFWGSLENGAWKKEADNPDYGMRVADKIDAIVQIATSRSHPSNKMNTFLTQFKKFELHPIGSSLKICLVSNGSVHLYPRLGPTMEWDTAAGHAVLKSAGGEILQFGTSAPLQYNKQDLLNPAFIAGNLSILESLQIFN